MPDPKTEEMRIVQSERAAEESELARESVEDEGTATHERRAERAAYLKAKLDARARSEDDAQR